jgi:large subunit ribosomal protein L3
MNQNPGLIGKKIGMTQIFDEKGEVLRCTVVQAGCVVIGKRTLEKDGYSALVLGLRERKESRTKKPLLGQYKKSEQTPKQYVREMRVAAEHVAKFEVGQKLPIDQIFEVGQFVDAQGITRGRGFTGVMRRWSFAGGVGSHGTHEYFRHGGSIGTNMTPGRTLPGLKMPGHYGDETVTAQNLKIARLMVDEDLVLIEGAVPGAKNGVVFIRGAVKKKNAGKKKA